MKNKMKTATQKLRIPFKILPTKTENERKKIVVSKGKFLNIVVQIYHEKETVALN